MQNWLECNQFIEDNEWKRMERLTGSQQHELKSRAAPSGIRLWSRVERLFFLLLSFGLGLGVRALSPGGGQWLHDILRS